MTFGERVRLTRERHNMTQEDLARAIGLKTKAAVSKIEKGITNPNQTTIAKIAKALGETPAYFFGYQDEKFEEYLPYLENADDSDLRAIRKILGMPVEVKKSNDGTCTKRNIC